MTPTRRGARPTLADVAERSGMSKAAVSLILNNRPGSRLSEEAAERVRAAAAELGYRPNPAAQSLRLGRTRTIGLVSDEVTLTRHASGMISGALESAKRHDHTVLIAETGGDPAGIADAFDAMLDRRVDGMVVCLMAARMIDVPETTADIPVVLVNGTSPADHPHVLPDERPAGHAMAQMLLDAGHRRIGILGDLPEEIWGDPRRSATIALRFAGIDQALDAAGITPARSPIPEWTPEAGHRQTHRLLEANPDLTAILAGNDAVAFGVYQALHERQLRVPEDISVVSFDDEELATYLRPGLTTARLPYDTMAALGVDMLLGDRELSHELVPMPVIRRESVAPAPAPTAHGDTP
ncbi:LacI family DNA-binding transcriptional regulator [Brachybacterium hainanense]|uniref:LacI family DNA-binding transcriptional regulator n=1 Tax=Brachybacterium hainanense TaxID=1541174 RepID=A0ABV6RDE4_9MICO